jgi:hypothetical protein
MPKFWMPQSKKSGKFQVLGKGPKNHTLAEYSRYCNNPEYAEIYLDPISRRPRYYPPVGYIPGTLAALRYLESGGRTDITESEVKKFLKNYRMVIVELVPSVTARLSKD